MAVLDWSCVQEVCIWFTDSGIVRSYCGITGPMYVRKYAFGYRFKYTWRLLWQYWTGLVFRRYAFGLQIQGYLEVTVAVLDRFMLGSMHLVYRFRYT